MKSIRTQATGRAADHLLRLADEYGIDVADLASAAIEAAIGKSVPAASFLTRVERGELPEATTKGQFAAMLEQHAYPERELAGLLARCADLGASLVAARPQLLSLAQGPRLAEAVILVEAALKSDARFFAPTPDLVTPLSKRVASGGRPELALRILQPFVRENRDHKLHLPAGLFAALLLAEQLKKPEVAKKFLLQLKQIYPDEQFIDQQLRRLAP